MARIYGEIDASTLMTFDKSFSLANGQPLDNKEVFYSKAAAETYAASDSAYVGKKIVVIETVDEVTTVTHYGIEANGSLKELGSATAGDGKSIDLGDGNVLSLKNFGKKYYKYVPATETTEATYELIEDGTFPAGLQPKTRLADDGTIELAWYEPSGTTVEGLSEQMSSLSETVNTMQGTVSNNAAALENKVDKVNGKQLSTEDYTTEDKEKLAGITAGAQVNVIEEIHVNSTKQTVTDKKVNITVPTKVSDLVNDSNFIDNTVGNLTNYYLKSETFTRDEVNDLLSAISTLDTLVVDELPSTDISTTTIYLVSRDGGEGDVYDEYIYVASTSKWELIGHTALDLTNYLQKNGDASEVTVAFTAASERALPASGEALNIILGKIVKYLTDLHAVAFSGSYNDLVDKPTQTAYFLSGTLTAGSTSVEITIPEGGYMANVSVRDSEGIVFTDVDYSNNVVTVSISEAYATDLTILVTYYK